MAAMFLVSLMLCAVQWQGGQSAEGASLPYPSISITHSAKLLKLECTLPPPSVRWSQIFKVSLFKHPDFRDPTRNVSLVNMTSLMTQPKMANLPADSNVTFTGRWDKAVSLTLTMPLSEAERGRYYCTAEHKIPADVSVYSTEVVVDEESVQSGRSGGELPFVFRVIPVDRVHVTWLNPGSAHDFTEASVSREEMDRSGKPLTAASTLYLTGPGARDFVRTGEVLLHKMTDIGGNSSVTLYVDPAPCAARCQYGCRVSFRDCVGPDARHCVCGQAEEAESGADGAESGADGAESCADGAESCADKNVLAVLSGITLAVLVIVVVVGVGVWLVKSKRLKCSLCRNKPPADPTGIEDDGGLPANGGGETSALNRQTGSGSGLPGRNKWKYSPVSDTLPPQIEQQDEDLAASAETETGSRKRPLAKKGDEEEQQDLLKSEARSEDVSLPGNEPEGRHGGQQSDANGEEIEMAEASRKDTTSNDGVGNPTSGGTGNLAPADGEYDHSQAPSRHHSGTRQYSLLDGIVVLEPPVNLYSDQDPGQLGTSVSHMVSPSGQALLHNTDTRPRGIFHPSVPTHMPRNRPHTSNI